MQHGGTLTRKIAPRGLSHGERLHWHGWDVTQTGCWEWAGERRVWGYGTIRYLSGHVVAHRAAYETWVGPIPEGHVVRHKCDNPPCINPDHLETGTYADNSRDMVERGRSSKVRGGDHHNAKLTWDEAQLVREAYKTGVFKQNMLAEALGVRRQVISDICSGKTYAAWRSDE